MTNEEYYRSIGKHKCHVCKGKGEIDIGTWCCYMQECNWCEGARWVNEVYVDGVGWTRPEIEKRKKIEEQEKIIHVLGRRIEDIRHDLICAQTELNGHVIKLDRLKNEISYGF